MNDASILAIGYMVCISAGFTATGLIIWFVAYFNIRACKYCVEMVGDWVLFNEFIKWKRSQNNNHNKACNCDGCERSNLRLGGHQPCASKNTGEGRPPKSL